MTITRQSADFTFDANMQLKDAGLVAASAAATVGGSGKIIDVGNGVRIDARAIVDVSAVETDSGDELYQVQIQGSTDAAFATGVVNLGVALYGDSSKTNETVDSVSSRREVAFCNEFNGVLYRYLRGYTVVSGTVATGINYKCFIVQET